MPVAIVGTPSVTTFSAVASGNANFPATVNAGELLTLDFSQAFDVGITTPSGWTPLGAVGDGFAGNRAASFYKIAAGTEGGTTLALTFGGSCDAVAIITRHSGFDSTTPINGTPTTNSGTTGSTTAITSPSVTTSVNNCLVRRFVGTRDSTGIAVPSGQTDGGTGTTGTAATNATNRVGYSTQSTAGATGTVTFVGTGNSREWVAVTYAIAPSPGPTITAQPTDQTVNNGATATFSVTATGTAPITYQWQDNSSGSFANIGGATSSSYAPTASYAMQGRQYRCLVSDAGGGPVTSSAATLRVAFNLSGTGPRAYPRLGAPFGAGSVESWLRGSASGGGTSLTPTNAAITVTGFAPTISQPHVANPGVGALTLASFAPTVAQGTNLAPSVGALALATYAPSIAQPQSVSPAVGALTLATYVPSVVQNTILTPAQIGLAITSFAPVVVQNTNVDPATIALSLSGPAPTVTQATLLTPASAALVLAGPSPTVSQAAASSITPDVVALSLATFAPTISQPIASNPLPGSLTLSTYAPSVSQALNVVPDVGSLSLSTFAPSIAQPVDVVPSVAALALGTFATSVSQDLNVTPASSALVLNGYAPSVTQVPPGSQSVTPDVGSLTVVTYEPIVSRLGGGGYDDDKPKRKHRWLVQIGKKTYEVGSMREAQALLDRKEEEATQQAEKVVQKKAPKSRARIVKAPEPVAQAKRSSTDTAMQTQEILRRIQEYNATIDAIVRLAQEQDDEEALLMLL